CACVTLEAAHANCMKLFSLPVPPACFAGRLLPLSLRRIRSSVHIPASVWPAARLMQIGPYSPVPIVAPLLALVALFSTVVAAAADIHSFRSGVTALLIAPAQAEETNPPAASDTEDFEQFIARNPGTLLGTVALPVILLLTILVRRRHYL